MSLLRRVVEPDPADMAAQINRRLDSVGGTLRFYGAWFGRPYDNHHKLVSASSDGETLRLEFNEGETLLVWNPGGLRFLERGFLIETAQRVRWEWFYYGRPALPENRYFLDYEPVERAVRVSSNVDWSEVETPPSSAVAAVELA